jgi:hypothetical protein
MLHLTVALTPDDKSPGMIIAPEFAGIDPAVSAVDEVPKRGHHVALSQECDNEQSGSLAALLR